MPTPNSGQIDHGPTIPVRIECMVPCVPVHLYPLLGALDACMPTDDYDFQQTSCRVTGVSICLFIYLDH